MSEQEINRIIAENIVRFMDKKGLSQLDVAEHCGVSQASVSNWCKGVKMPRMDKIDKMCELFGCSRTDLIDEYDPKTEPTVEELRERLFSDRPEYRALLDAADDLDTETVLGFADMMKTWAKNRTQK